jgi:hypothetical protein
VTISGGTLTLTLAQARAPNVTSSVSIAWWVYVAGFVTGGFAADTIIAAANLFGGSIADNIISNLISSSLSTITTAVPLPAGTPTLTVRQVSLSQSDAPPTTVMVFGIPIPLAFPMNDVIINLI